MRLSTAGALVGVLAILAGAGAAIGGAQKRHAASSAVCGGERWAVKTLSDSRENLVNFTPQVTSIRHLRRKPDPHTSWSTPRIEGAETTTYRVKARLIGFKRERDHDVHLTIAVPSSPAKTMIVEFPDTTCNGAASSPKKAAMAKGRSQLIAACGQPPGPSSAFRHLKGTATITGVGFFDVKQATPQPGVAPNNIELHPVLRLSARSCTH